MTVFRKIGDRVLSRLGLDLDFSVDLRDAPFTPITGTVHLGSRPTLEHVEALKQAGVTHVVSCLMEQKRDQMGFLQERFDHLFLAVRDAMDQDISGTFAQFFDFASAVATSDEDAKLLVHCEVGVSRSATLVTALLMKTEGMTFFDALSQVRSKRFRVLPNIGFASQLQRLEHELQPSTVTVRPSSLARYLHGVCNAPVELDILEEALERHRYDAPAALRAIFGGEIPRVVQGVRS